MFSISQHLTFESATWQGNNSKKKLTPGVYHAARLGTLKILHDKLLFLAICLFFLGAGEVRIG